MNEATDTFIKLFGQERFLEAWRLFFPSPDSIIGTGHPMQRALWHLAHACVYDTPKHAFLMARHFDLEFGDDIRFSLTDESFLDTLHRIIPFLAYAGGQGEELSLEQLAKLCAPQDLETFSYVIAEHERVLLDPAIGLDGHASQNWVRFAQKYPDFAESIAPECRPFFSLSYSGGLPIPELGEVPMVILEPYDMDWGGFREILGDRNCILGFLQSHTFFHCLQFSEILELLLSGQALPFILNRYPHEQFAAWPQILLPTDIHFLGPQSRVHQNLAQIQHAVLASLQNYSPSHPVDTEESNQLYEVGKKLAFSLDADRLGPSRYLSHHMRHALFDCFWDTHKERPRHSIHLQGPCRDWMAEALPPPISSNERRPYVKKDRYRLAHVFRTVYDTAHAPTKLLRSLLSHHDRGQFELFLYCTESGRFRTWDYPLHNMQKTSSREVGQNTLELCKQYQIPVRILDTSQVDYHGLSQQLIEKMKQDEIDIALYHYPDPVALLSTRLSDVPLHVLFSHGGADQWPDDQGFVLPEYLGLPTHPGFDLIIEADERSREDKARYEALGAEVLSEGFVVDVGPSQATEPYSRSELGLPQKGPILGSISLHLSTRLSRDFCWAVAEILKRHPDSVYAPIGPVPEGDSPFKRYFREFDVNDQVIYLGMQAHPERILPLVSVYLNEFPYGGGIALLEAMAMGIPIVTMYDPNGRPQERYGGIYAGLDWSIQSLQKEDYVDLADRILRDHTVRKKYSQTMKERYLIRTDIEGYMKRIETAMLDLMEAKEATSSR